MLNSEETYRESGRKCAIAMHHRDMSGFDFEKNWFNRAKALEKPEIRRAIQDWFDDAYREEAQSYDRR